MLESVRIHSLGFIYQSRDIRLESVGNLGFLGHMLEAMASFYFEAFLREFLVVFSHSFSLK